MSAESLAREALRLSESGAPQWRVRSELRKVVDALSAPPADDLSEALADAFAELDEAVTEYRRVFPEPWSLAPNLGLAVTFAAALRTPPANDVGEALDHLDALNESGRIQYADYVALHDMVSRIEVRPRGTVTDAERLEYTVAAISDNGAITSLSGESTVVRDHLRGDLELYRQQQVEAGCDPECIIIAQRTIPKWARS